MNDRQRTTLNSFLDELSSYRWFLDAGERSESFVVLSDFVEAVDGSRNGWGRKSYEIWADACTDLESSALEILQDKDITRIFNATSSKAEQPIWDGINSYFNRQFQADPKWDESGVNAGLIGDVQASVLRDIAWAAVEQVIDKRGFFSELLPVYRSGRWPCGWTGKLPPSGRVVII